MKYNNGILTLNLRKLNEIVAIIIMHFCVYVVWFSSEINIRLLVILEICVVVNAIQNWWDERQDRKYELELIKNRVELEKLGIYD